MINTKYAIQIHRNYENFKKAFEILKTKVGEDVLINKKELKELKQLKKSFSNFK